MFRSIFPRTYRTVAKWLRQGFHKTSKSTNVFKKVYFVGSNPTRPTMKKDIKVLSMEDLAILLTGKEKAKNKTGEVSYEKRFRNGSCRFLVIDAEDDYEPSEIECVSYYRDIEEDYDDIERMEIMTSQGSYDFEFDGVHSFRFEYNRSTGEIHIFSTMISQQSLLPDKVIGEAEWFIKEK